MKYLDFYYACMETGEMPQDMNTLYCLVFEGCLWVSTDITEMTEFAWKNGVMGQTNIAGLTPLTIKLVKRINLEML